MSDRVQLLFPPGFSELSLNDQMRLLQSSWSEILTLSLVFRSIPTSGRLNFAADFSLSEAEARECGLTEFFNHVSITEKITSSIVVNYNLNNTQYALCCGEKKDFCVSFPFRRAFTFQSSRNDRISF